MVDFSQTFQGAAGGAMAGSAFGPWGAGIGAGVGLLGGLFGGDGQAAANQQYKDQLARLAATYANRQAPQATTSDFRQQQTGLIAQLQALAAGNGPSAAASQMQDAMDRAASSQTSMAAGAAGRGVNQGAAYLNASNNSAAMQQQAARDTATLRAQEQLNAYGQANQAIATARGADESMNLANLQARLQTMGLNDEGQLKALMGAVGVNTGPGLGTQILAGGAQALPTILQMRQRPQQAMQPQTGQFGAIGSNMANGFAGGGMQGNMWERLGNG